MAVEDYKWYYDLSTGEVSQGKTPGFENRMGPYDTEEEARHAISIASARTHAADRWDEEED
ncbi:hypothetical protein N24_2299 [Corynebacterium suranareeae]|uniref:SPOR domain-containing protein n=1 Tax=Corynebacterium suranareeae TaxID=2506452 RepID=A0A160PU10_9CORY|nr:hypothetical protein [Corynebacterium suranareeae]BAU96561.1 hypothetical protein N24_2299 [Corynebacterium suranareeae]